MKKTEDLLKKIEVFEKLASYGNKNSFLKSLGQAFNGVSFPQEALKELLDAIGAKLDKLQRDWESSELQSSPNARNLKIYAKAFTEAAFTESIYTQRVLEDKVNSIRRNRDNVLTILDKAPQTLAVEAANVKNDLSRLEPLLNGFMRNTAKVSYPGEEEPAKQEAPATPTAPADHIKYPSIDKDKQAALNNVMRVYKLGPELKVDGILGPKTRAALDAWKKYLKEHSKVEGENISDNNALLSAQMV